MSALIGLLQSVVSAAKTYGTASSVPSDMPQVATESVNCEVAEVFKTSANAPFAVNSECQAEEMDLSNLPIDPTSEP